MAQAADPRLKPFFKLAQGQDPYFRLRAGLLYRASQSEGAPDLLVVPQPMEDLVLQEYHDGMSHLGINRTLAWLSERFWLPKIWERVVQYIQLCDVC